MDASATGAKTVEYMAALIELSHKYIAFRKRASRKGANCEYSHSLQTKLPLTNRQCAARNIGNRGGAWSALIRPISWKP